MLLGLLKRIRASVAPTVERAVAAARQECRTQIGPSPVYESIGRMVERQAGRLERELAGTAK